MIHLQEIWIQSMNEEGIVKVLAAPGIAERIKCFDIYEIRSAVSKRRFDVEEESDDPHMDT